MGAGCSAVAGALAGVPVAAIAHGVSPTGPLRLAARWWTGAPAPRNFVVAVVALCAGTAAIVGARLPTTVTLPAFWLFAIVGVALAVIDARCSRLPHSLTGLLLTSSAVCFVAAVITGADAGSLGRAAIAGSVTAAILLTIAFILPGQLGLGDVAFAGVIAFNLGWLSWQAVVYGVAGGWLAQAAIVTTARFLRRGRRLVPLGPALMCGWLLAVVCAS